MLLAGGSLRSPPTRNPFKISARQIVKNSIYIIILSVCLCMPTSGSLVLLGSLSVLIVNGIGFCALRARGAHEAEFFFHESISFTEAVY